MIDSVSSDTIRTVARRVFGSEAAVSCIREIAASKNHGITETPPSTRNLLYVVELEGHSRPYVFRFSRVEDDVYEQEIENYRLLSEATGVRVPTIYRLDTSKRIVPTSYMVMEYLCGKLWQYLAHPDNPRTDRRDKDAITSLVGSFHARVHDVTTEAPQEGSEAQTLGYSIDRLEAAARRGTVDATPAEIDRCRQAVREEPLFQQRTLNLCLADTEVHVARRNDGWELAFVCDAEWVEFRHRYADLAQYLAAPHPWWSLRRPATDLHPSDVAALPFFRGYASHRPIDYEELLHHAAYYQLALWAYVAMTSRSPEKKAWVKEDNGPLIRRLIHVISERVRRPAPTS